MQMTLEPWNGGLGLRIPDSLVTAARLRPESIVDIDVQDGRLVVTSRNSTSSRLNDLLAQVTEDNLHEEFATGPAVGREAW